MFERTLLVAEINQICVGVREFVLAPPDSSFPLKPHAPGSHLLIQAGPRANAYSLTGDGYQPDAYRISVRRQGGGGGSDWLHDTVRPGDHLPVSHPRSAFAPTLAATNHLLVAAGIGVTPMLSHLQAAIRWNRSFELIYGYSAPRAPYLDRVRALGGDRVTAVEGRVALQRAVAAALARQPVGTHAYACGPAQFLEAFVATALALGWPEDRLHVEYFQAPVQDAGKPFRVRLASSGRLIDVPGGVSLLEALDAAGVVLPRLCKRGVCGQCRVTVRSGVPEHRDLLLSRAERDRNDCLFPCVSRARSAVLELEL